MSHQITEKAGNLKRESSESKHYRRHLFSRMLCQPIFLVVYVLFCRYAYRLCMYGGMKRRGSILAACLLFFVIYLIVYIVRCVRIKVAENQEPDLENVWFYGFTKKGVYLFDKKRNYYEQNLSKEKKDFVKLKYKKVPTYRYHFMKIPVYIFLLVVMVMTALGIYKSSQKYNGKLAWILEELKTSDYVKLEHNNLYADGILGIFYDINGTVMLPENLTIDGAFNLHFEKDGTIKTFDMMLRGYDEQMQYVGSYLISYPSSRGGRILVQKHNYHNAPAYDEEKSIEALLKGGDILPYKEVISEWNEEEYGVYYLGSRTWKEWDENIFVLEEDGSVRNVQWGDKMEITGYSISIFGPDNSDIAPKRYMIGAENDMDAEEETFSEENVGEKIYYPADYGQISAREAYYDNEKGERTYYYMMGCFYFNDEKYSEVNETLKKIYDAKEQEYRGYCEEYAPGYEIDETISDEMQRVNYYHWNLSSIVYVNENFVKLEFYDITYNAGEDEAENRREPIVIEVETGWQVAWPNRVSGYD